MIVNQNTLDAANTTFFAKFDEVFANQPPGPWDMYTERIPTDSKVNEIDVLETMPVVREWVGSKVYQDIRASNLSVTCKKYEKSFRISRMDLVADRMGMVGKRISQFMTQDGGTILDKLAFDTLVSASGAGPLCYDGLRIFSASHVRSNGTTWSNLTTTALSFAQHDAVMVAGSSRVDDNNEPLKISFDTLIVGPKLFKIATEITQSKERIVAVANDGLEAGTRVAASTIPNVYGGGSMTLIVDPRLVGTQDDYYYYLDTKRGPKPLVYFELEAPHAEALDSMGTSARFDLDEYRYSVELYGGFGGGSPHVATAGVL